MKKVHAISHIIYRSSTQLWRIVIEVYIIAIISARFGYRLYTYCSLQSFVALNNNYTYKRAVIGIIFNDSRALSRSFVTWKRLHIVAALGETNASLALFGLYVFIGVG